MKRFAFLARTLVTTLVALALGTTAASADEVTCTVCKMKIDTKHRVHFRYVAAGKTLAEIGSLSCTKKYWSDNKERKMVFEGQDFATGEWIDATKGHFLVYSKLPVGTGMDKGGAAIVFRDEAMAKKAQAVNGGKIVNLPSALEAVAR